MRLLPYLEHMRNKCRNLTRTKAPTSSPRSDPPDRSGGSDRIGTRIGSDRTGSDRVDILGPDPIGSNSDPVGRLL